MCASSNIGIDWIYSRCFDIDQHLEYRTMIITTLLTCYFIMLKNGQTYFKHRKIFKVCLAIFQHYEIKG